MGKPVELPTNEEVVAAANTLSNLLSASVYEQYHLLEKHDIHPQLFHLYMENLKERFTTT